MTAITHGTGPTPTHPSDTLWTTPVGRGFAGLLLVSVLVVVSLVLYGGVRDASVASGPEWLTATWGWLPSYLAALATPFMWPLLGRRALGRTGPLNFLPEVAMGGCTVLLVEVLDATGAGGTFSWSDVIAALAGALSAFLLYRALVGPSPKTNARE